MVRRSVAVRVKNDDWSLEPYRKWRRLQKLLFHARPQHHEHYADSENSNRNRSRNLHGFLFVHRSFDRTDLRDFFLFVIIETRVDESNHAKNQKYGSKNNHKALHSSKPITTTRVCVRNASRDTPLAGLARKCPDWLTETYERLAAASAS